LNTEQKHTFQQHTIIYFGVLGCALVHVLSVAWHPLCRQRAVLEIGEFGVAVEFELCAKT
jgi:hypothetical protein